ncbi:chromosome segregation ATPase [Phormidium sp. LEGE 05292]|uniref:chromosome segregation ATPase n=1 Tax=[Phormidium] sp. LEGE 05292 TaxID=767427 RepID=UPI00187F42C9|nr:chromosome segregation ATPase [Phormidium sp. LEGE 05292]MBE9226100.1 chromosome segregation ATPase [Phormidium sp. LEGE 05292]
MRERGNPNQWLPMKASEQGNKNRFPQGSLRETPIPPLIPNNAVQPKGTLHEEPKVEASVSPASNEYETPVTVEEQTDKIGESEASVNGKLRQISKKLKQVQIKMPPAVQQLTGKWQFWVALATVSAGGVGTLAVALLLTLPALPNCSSINLMTASASERISCAETLANKQTVKGLLEAISLVKTLPPDHPLRDEANALIKEWSQEILNLADKSFDTGKLDEAIATAKKIPSDVPAYTLVEKRIQRWRAVWAKAEGYYRAAEAEVRKENWTQAFREAVRLLYIGNKYWESTKYEELTQIIASARQDGESLTKARKLADEGGVKNLLEAIKLAQGIGSKSYLYEASKTAIVEFGRKMLDLAQKQLDNQDVDGALSIVRQIPSIVNLQGDVEDFTNLAQALALAQEGTVGSLDAAINQVQRISPNRPLYDKAQDWLLRWQKEQQDVAQLDKARQLAGMGSINDLQAAIREAQQIPENNPRSQEAKQQIAAWQAQIQTIEDRPKLQRAQQVASLGDNTSLAAAVNEASKIGRGRALYSEAQSKISQWTGQIQRMEDQPYLDQARQLANSGNFAAAINTAQQIKPGRSLSNQAQSAIQDWQAQVRTQQNWQQAQQLASAGTADSLVSAIQLLRGIPRSSAMRSEAETAMNQWSYQILSQAQDRANYDLPGAIEIAKSIPPGTSAYAEAKAQIEVWKNILNPPPPPSPEYFAPQQEQAPVTPAATPEATPETSSPTETNTPVTTP